MNKHEAREQTIWQQHCMVSQTCYLLFYHQWKCYYSCENVRTFEGIIYFCFRLPKPCYVHSACAFCFIVKFDASSTLTYWSVKNRDSWPGLLQVFADCKILKKRLSLLLFEQMWTTPKVGKGFVHNIWLLTANIEPEKIILLELVQSYSY
jgi:hypothetical protein